MWQSRLRLNTYPIISIAGWEHKLTGGFFFQSHVLLFCPPFDASFLNRDTNRLTKVGDPWVGEDNLEGEMEHGTGTGREQHGPCVRR